MAAYKDTDTESISGNYLDLGDFHTHGDEEFYECEDYDEDDVGDEYFDTQDFQDDELPQLIPRDTKAKKFLPPLDSTYLMIRLVIHGLDSKRRDIAWSQCQQEVKYWREKVGMKGDGKPDVNTSSYMDLDKYKAIWRILDNYKKHKNYSSRA